MDESHRLDRLINSNVLYDSTDSAVWAGSIGLQTESDRGEEAQQLSKDDIEDGAIEVGNLTGRLERDHMLRFCAKR